MNSRTDSLHSLISQKTALLAKLLETTKVFLDCPADAIVNAESPKDDPLSLYERDRTQILKTMELLDREINQGIPFLSKDDKTPEWLEKVRVEQTQHDQLIIAIMNLDEWVFKKISDAQVHLSKVLNETHKGKEALGKFKSLPPKVGEEMDQTI